MTGRFGIDYEDYDESSVRTRPNPKANRPRSKRRPEHGDAQTGFIIGVDRGRYRVRVADRTTTAARASELRNESLVVGDRVHLVGDTSGEPGTLARIVRIDSRTTVLRRSADDSDNVERVIVANADQMLIVVAAADPEPRPRLIDRYLVAAYDARMHPILCITKTDLADPGPLLASIAGAGVSVVTSSCEDLATDTLLPLLAGHFSVLVGHSGVGKSTLFNALVPDAERATGHVNAVTGRGRHTSSSAVAFELSYDGHTGWVVDTPGIRSFGLGHVDPGNIVAAYPDLAAIATSCPRGCTHLPDSPDCAIIEAVASGELDATGASRLDSLQRLLSALT